jgi:hypothetical protein
MKQQDMADQITAIDRLLVRTFWVGVLVGVLSLAWAVWLMVKLFWAR